MHYREPGSAKTVITMPNGTQRKRWPTVCGRMTGKATARRYAVTCRSCLCVSGIDPEKEAREAGIIEGWF